MTPSDRRDAVAAAGLPAVELRDLLTFLAVAEELHFGRAAERLGLKASRVSQIVNALETKIGGRLFDRTSRRVRLTPLGEEMRQRTGPTYELLQRACVEVGELAMQPSRRTRRDS